MGFYDWDVSGVWSCGHAVMVPWRQKVGFDLPCVTCSQAGSWHFKNNKGDTMYAKQFVTHKSLFKDESFVKGLPGGMWNTKISGNLVNYLNWMLQVIDVKNTG